MQKAYNSFLKELNNETLVMGIVSNLPSPSRARTLLFNIKNFPEFKQNILNEKYSIEYLCKYMPSSEMTCKQKEEDFNKELIFKPDISQIEDGIIKCENCDSMKTEYEQYHKLENSIIYCHCHACNWRWKIE